MRTLVLSADASPFPLRDLTPGASYRLELHSIFENRDSEVAAIQNFTTRTCLTESLNPFEISCFNLFAFDPPNLGPNTPGRFIVWFRNETTLLVLWQPPYPAGIYSNYKVRYPKVKSLNVIYSCRYLGIDRSTRCCGKHTRSRESWRASWSCSSSFLWPASRFVSRKKSFQVHKKI